MCKKAGSWQGARESASCAGGYERLSHTGVRDPAEADPRMVKRRLVQPLASWAKRAVPRLVQDMVLRAAHGVHSQWFR